MNLWWLALPALLLLFAALIRYGERQRLARIRATWGAPVERTRRMDAIAASHTERTTVLGGGSLDERTWVDLDLDLVFSAIDRTQSTLGQHALYHRLRTAPVGSDLGVFEALVQRFSVDASARERAQLALARLQDPQGYDLWWLARADAVERHSRYVVFPIITATAIVLVALAPWWSGAFAALVGLLALNVGVRYATDFRVSAIARRFRQCAPLIATAGSLRFLTGDDIDPIVKPLQMDVPALARLKLIARWVTGDPFMLSVSPDRLIGLVSDVVATLYEYLNLVFLLDATGVYFGSRDLSRHGPALVRVTAAVGDVDAAISVASFRESESDWTRPDFRAPGSMCEWRDLLHPLVDEPVPNSIDLRSGRGVLITGSNMSGKSTFLRTVGVNAILAQTINTCLAREYRAPVFHVRSCIGRSDDLVAGKSYYIAEVEALLELVRASEGGTAHLFLLDELFRGTNAVERIAAGHAVLQQLVQPHGAPARHVVIAATHDRELVDLATDPFETYHFGDSIGPDGLTFDHLLRRGPATTRNAIALLRLHGAPETLLKQAVTTAEMLDRERGNALIG